MTGPVDDWIRWPPLEWFVGAAWTAGLVVAAFLYRLSLRVALLENTVKERDTATERRHQENLTAWRELREEMSRLTARIDRLVDR